MCARIEPEPTREERDAILAALDRVVPADSSWAATVLLEGVEEGELDP